MRNVKSGMGIITALAVAVSFALYKMPTRSENKNPGSAASVSAYNFVTQLDQIKKSLKRQELEPVTQLEQTIEAAPENKKVLLLDSIGKTWDRLEQPQAAAHYFEELALVSSSEKNWINAAYRYFDAYKASADSVVRHEMVAKAISSYSKVLEINPGNLDAKTDLGICYAEGTNEPMKGISLLREVVSINPQHENAQYNLGLLSMKSGQYEKAIERFKKVISINKTHVNAYYLLGIAYMKAGDKKNALENLETFKKMTNDAEAIAEADQYINQLNK